MDSSSAASRAEAMDYKLRKEAFVSNLTGSSLYDINLVTLVALSAILLWTGLSKRGVLKQSDTAVIYAIDFLLHVCTILFAFTIYASTPYFLNLALIVPAVLFFLPIGQQSGVSTKIKHKSNKHKASRDDAPKSDSVQDPERSLSAGTLIVRPFLTNYRGAMLIETAIAILAVDFRIFPRRFAKVETWGTSMMDLGVGSFVFSAGVVSARAVIREAQSSSATSTNSIASRLLQACRHSLPLFVLGIVRLISVKNLDYAEHVTEYGVHWNFFFTLGFLPPFVEAVDSCLALLRKTISTNSQPLRRSIRYDVVALGMAFLYEMMLNNTGLLSFILISPRTPASSLLAKNREGVFSFIGYLAIFLSGRSTGILTCQFQLEDETRQKHDKALSTVDIEVLKIQRERWKVILPQLACRALVFSGLYFFTTSVYAVNLTVSRRLANVPYVLWILAYNNAQLFVLAGIENFGPKFVFSKSRGLGSNSEEAQVPRADEMSSPVLRAFNKNGLAIFLVSNLGTGIVNLTMNTLDMGNLGAMNVLVVYMGTLTAVAVGLQRMGINIKL